MSQRQAECSPTVVENLGLTEDEYDKIVGHLGRHPNFTELSIYSVMWSEHCSYKNSIKLLKTLPRDGENMLVSAGEENAGLIDIGGGLGCAFKIESHNHPSAIEPYQGAATGVGGIHRDIFTMGARPIAALNSLRFGNIHSNHTKHLVKGVVKGIGDYGNCLGVPTVAGEVYFDDCYKQNILVNAMSVGVVDVDQTASAIAIGDGNPVFIVGSKTGKDGIHGATFASADLTEDSAEDLPSVQVGDPFQEKLLLEASLEAIQSNAVIGIQDMGAAGITCSTSEMSAKGESGMVINLDNVPTRQSNMKAWEILLSESQERMLIVAEQGKESVLQEIFDKWDLDCHKIGHVDNSGWLKFYHGGELVAEVNADSLVLGGGAPVYDRESQRPNYQDTIDAFTIESISEPKDLLEVAKKTFTSPNLVSKNWITEQYDSMVRTNSMSTNLPSDAALVRVKGTSKALAVTVDCNSRYVFADPHKGAMIAVAEAARNITCSGGRPAAITNCLNFGNPYNPEVYWQFSNAIKGMGEACRRFGTPVTGGNVSFYNQSVLGDKTEPVYPTPTIGMVGLLDHIDDQMTLDFKGNGDLIFMIGTIREDINQSEYLRTYHEVEHSPSPYFDIEEEVEIQEVVAEIIKKGMIRSAHDISEGGLFQNLLESSFPGEFGFTLDFVPTIRKDAFLFGESQSRIVVSVDVAQKSSFEQFLSSKGISFAQIGVVTDGDILIWGDTFGTVKDWKSPHETTLSHYLNS